MGYKCPRCGWEHNEYDSEKCQWCGQRLPKLGVATRLDPETLDGRMEGLKWSIKDWIVDVRECFHVRGVEDEWSRKLIRDFALWFMDIAGTEKSLFCEEKTLENKTENAKSDSDDQTENGNNKHRLIQSDGVSIPTGFLCGFAAGIWTGILIRIAIRLLGYICGIG